MEHPSNARLPTSILTIAQNAHQWRAKHDLACSAKCLHWGNTSRCGRTAREHQDTGMQGACTDTAWPPSGKQM